MLLLIVIILSGTPVPGETLNMRKRSKPKHYFNFLIQVNGKDMYTLNIIVSLSVISNKITIHGRGFPPTPALYPQLPAILIS